MNRNAFLLPLPAALLCIFLCMGCEKEPVDNCDSFTSLTQSAKDMFLFYPGSQWVYEDTASGQKDTVTLQLAERHDVVIESPSDGNCVSTYEGFSSRYQHSNWSIADTNLTHLHIDGYYRLVTGYAFRFGFINSTMTPDTNWWSDGIHYEAWNPGVTDTIAGTVYSGLLRYRAHISNGTTEVDIQQEFAPHYGLVRFRDVIDGEDWQMVESVVAQ